MYSVRIGRLVLLVALVAALSACGSSAPAIDQQQRVAEFLTERNNGTPVALPAASSAVAGTIEAIDGAAITVQTLIDRRARTIRVAPDAKVTQQRAAEASDIKPGDAVVVFGESAGEQLTATEIQIGGAPGAMVIAGAGGPTSGDQLAPAGAQAAPQPMTTGTSAGPGIAGTVTRVDGAALELRTADGSTQTVALASDVRVSATVDVSPAELETGQTILAEGRDTGGTFEATAIRVLPAPPTP